MVKIDLLDKKILYELDIDCRQPASKIGKKYNMSKERINYRIKNLEKKGIIKGYYPILDTSLLNCSFFKLFIKLKEITTKMREEIIEFLVNYKDMIQVMLLEGKFDIQLIIFIKSKKSMFEFLEHLNAFCGKEILVKENMIVNNLFRFNQRNLFDGGKINEVSVENKDSKYRLEEIDLLILRELSKDARISLIEIAKNIGTSFQVVQYRMKKLIKDGVIKSFKIAINYNMLDMHHYHLTFQINDYTIIPKIKQFLIEEKKSIFMMRKTGQYDLSFEIMVKDNNELHKFTDKLRDQFSEFIDIMDIMHIYKEYQLRLYPL